MSQRTIRLSPNEILIHGRKHTLVPGYQEWSILRFASSPHFVTLYYKQDYVVSLREYANGKGYAERWNRKQRYPDLSTVVEAYKHDYSVKRTDRYNEQHGIVQWCQCGEAVATVEVTLSGEEMDHLEHEAKARGCDVEALATQMIKGLLSSGDLSIADHSYFRAASCE